MSESIFPVHASNVEPEQDPRYVSLDQADAMLEALASETARSLVGLLEAQPMTSSELADHVDTTLQNVSYHLQRLTDADVVETVDTSYSNQGREMNVYAPAADPVIIYVGDRESGNT